MRVRCCLVSMMGNVDQVFFTEKFPAHLLQAFKYFAQSLVNSGEAVIKISTAWIALVRVFCGTNSLNFQMSYQNCLQKSSFFQIFPNLHFWASDPGNRDPVPF